MSLTRHLRDRESPIGRFFRESFPHTRRVWRECPPLPPRSAGILPPKGAPYATLGTAFDYRLRYYFAVTPSELLTAANGASILAFGHVPLVQPSPTGESGTRFPGDLAPSFLQATDAVLQRLQPVGRRLGADDERLLARHCVVLALFEQVYRAGLWPGSPLVARRPQTLDDLLGVVEDAWVDDVCRLSWAFYDRFSPLLSQQAVLNPTFEGSIDVGGADADLILGGCLLDIKATARRERDGQWLRQLLGYVVLDYGDRYKIHSVGIYLARFHVMYRWTLDSLLDALTGGDVLPLADLRERLKCIARAEHDRVVAMRRRARSAHRAAATRRRKDAGTCGGS